MPHLIHGSYRLSDLYMDQNMSGGLRKQGKNQHLKTRRQPRHRNIGKYNRRWCEYWKAFIIEAKSFNFGDFYSDFSELFL